jgi:outer membrane protein OmpA-like peptidoglycan-associated protein
MKTTTISLATIAACLATMGCANWPMSASPVRPECQTQNHAIYYNFKEDDLRASADPIVRLITQQIAVCQQAGGELESVSIVGFPNRTDNSVGGDATATARGQAVLDALVAAGLPPEKIRLESYRLEPDDIDQPMRRRAEITVEMR